MPRPTGKWKLVSGKIYRLARAFKTSYDAIEYARVLKQTREVHVAKTHEGVWAVYWRERGADIDCALELRMKITET